MAIRIEIDIEMVVLKIKGILLLNRIVLVFLVWFPPCFIGNNYFSDLLFGICLGLEIWMKQVAKGKQQLQETRNKKLCMFIV